MTDRIIVIGCGNLLASDDGIGIHVARSIKGYDLATDVQVIEAGCPGLDLLRLWENKTNVIIIDAVISGAKPGTVHLFNSEQVIPREILPLSSHSFNVVDAIELGKKLDNLPEQLIIVGIELETEKAYREELSPSVEEAIPIACEQIIKEIERLKK